MTDTQKRLIEDLGLKVSFGSGKFTETPIRLASPKLEDSLWIYGGIGELVWLKLVSTTERLERISKAAELAGRNAHNSTHGNVLSPDDLCFENCPQCEALRKELL